MYCLIVNYAGWGEPDIHGPFSSVIDAQAYAERYRRRLGLPGAATPENNEAWTDEGWYFGIVQPTRDAV